MTDLTHAVGFLQNAYTIVLALALGEAFKQFVADSGERRIFWNRFPALVAFLFMIFPFFHGMSRYLFSTYLAPGTAPRNFAGYLMFDGIAFMLMSACFFVKSRSLAPDRWRRYFGALALLLAFDTVWILVAIHRGVALWIWIYLNIIVACVMVGLFVAYRREENSLVPPIVCMTTIMTTTVSSYFLMSDFYFPQ